ncbi:MAG: hypothetical protein AAF991_12100, partial [Pseudomonadota bacterium]
MHWTISNHPNLVLEPKLLGPFTAGRVLVNTTSPTAALTVAVGAAVLTLATMSPNAAGQGASDDDEAIETVIVSASRLGQTVAETGSSISILTSEDIQTLGLSYALDAI